MSFRRKKNNINSYQVSQGIPTGPAEVTNRRRKTSTFFSYISMYFIQHCFICRPSDSTVLGSNFGLLRLWHCQTDTLICCSTGFHPHFRLNLIHIISYHKVSLDVSAVWRAYIRTKEKDFVYSMQCACSLSLYVNIYGLETF